MKRTNTSYPGAPSNAAWRENEADGASANERDGFPARCLSRLRVLLCRVSRLRSGPEGLDKAAPGVKSGALVDWVLVLVSGRIAQLVEQLTLNQRVQGSNPCAPTNEIKDLGAGPHNRHHHRFLSGATMVPSRTSPPGTKSFTSRKRLALSCCRFEGRGVKLAWCGPRIPWG